MPWSVPDRPGLFYVIIMNIIQITTKNLLRAVWRLTYSIYVAQGYAKPCPLGKFIHYPQFDGVPETVVYGRMGYKVCFAHPFQTIVASCSITGDGPRGLPISPQFQREIEEVRKYGRVGVCWRLVSNQSVHILPLIGHAIEHGFDYLGSEHLLIEVNPRHVKFYCKSFGFKVIGGPVRDGSVNMAPAMLLYGETATIKDSWNCLKSRHQNIFTS